MAGEYLKSSVHVHSKLCDGKNTLDEIAVTAWRNGLQTLGFSGHSHTPCDLEYCMTQSRTALYKAQMERIERLNAHAESLQGRAGKALKGLLWFAIPLLVLVLLLMAWPYARYMFG